MRIADWPEDERPRERLLKHGAPVLSEAELLAIFLRTGIAGANAVELGRQLLARFGNLQRLFAAPLSEIGSVRGLGPAKYAQLQAVIEMARRALEEDIGERDAMSSPQAVREFLQLTWADVRTRSSWRCFSMRRTASWDRRSFSVAP